MNPAPASEPEQATRPVLSLANKPQFLAGMGYGIRYPVMLCTVTATSEPPQDLSWLDQAMREFIVESVPAESSEAGEPPTVALIDRVHHWHAALQRDFGIPVFGPCFIDRPSQRAAADGNTRYTLAIPYAIPLASQATLQWVLETVNHLLAAQPGSIAGLHRSLDALRSSLRHLGLRSTNAMHFLAAADQLDMQVTRMTRDIFAFGLGQHSRWLHSSITDKTPSIGVKLAKLKHESALVLRRFGMPVPAHAFASDEDQAVAMAAQLGYPVVVKPDDQDQGRGVAAGLGSEQSVRNAFRAAREFSKQILVEKHIHGEDYRFTVVHERVVKIMHRQPGGVLGDGVRTVTALLREVQASPEHQRAFRRQGKMRLELDQDARQLLKESGLSPQTVPAMGQFVPLRRKSNISSGGSHALLPVEEAHPDNCALAVRAARVLGLDLAGIDLIMPDARQAWHETGAAICEVNAQPQIGFRDTPQIYADILRELVPGHGAIAIHLVLMNGGPDESQLGTCTALAARLGCNALSTPLGAWIDGVQCVWKPDNSFAAAQVLLCDKKVRAALIVMRVNDVLRSGSPVARLESVGLLSPQASGTDAYGDKALRGALQRLRPHVREREGNSDLLL